MSPTERRERALEKAKATALTLDEEARITEGEYIRRENPIGNRSHLQKMLEHLQEQESRQEARREYDAQKLKKEQQDCPHNDHEHGVCIECGADILDDLIERAGLKDE